MLLTVLMRIKFPNGMKHAYLTGKGEGRDKGPIDALKPTIPISFWMSL